MKGMKRNPKYDRVNSKVQKNRIAKVKLNAKATRSLLLTSLGDLSIGLLFNTSFKPEKKPKSIKKNDHLKPICLLSPCLKAIAATKKKYNRSKAGNNGSSTMSTTRSNTD